MPRPDEATSGGYPYQALVDAMQEGAALIANDGTILYGNPALGALTGYPVHSLHGRTFTSLLDDGPEHGSDVPTEGRTERTIATKDGKQVSVSVSAHRMRADGQDITAVVIADLSSRRLDERLRESEAQQAFLVRLGDAFRPVSDPDEIVSIATRLLAQHCGFDRVFYCEVDLQNDVLTVTRDWVKPGVPSITGSLPLTDLGTDRVRLLTQGRPAVVDDLRTDRHGTRGSAYEALGVRAMVVWPVLEHGRWIGALGAHTVQPRHWTDGELSLICEAAERTWDALERARAEGALRESELRLQLAIDGAGLGTFAWNPQNDDGRCDGQTLRLFGLRAGDSLSLTGVLETLVHPDDRARYAAAIVNALDPDGTGHLSEDVRVLRPNGTWRWLSITGQTTFAGDPPVAAGMFGTCLDITARKTLDEQLRDHQTHLSLAIRSSNATTFEWDILNDRIRRLYSSEEALPQTTGEPDTFENVVLIVHPDDRAAFRQNVRAAMEHLDGLYESEHRIVRPSGAVRWVHESGRIEFSGGRAVRLIGVSHDITDRKIAETALLDSAREKDDFIALLAHELRNPLAPIRTAIGVLKSSGSQDPMLLRCRDIIVRQAAHMTRLLDDLLDVSRLSRGKLMLQPQLVRLRDVLDAAVETARPGIDERSHVLSVGAVSPALVIEGDVARLTQVFANLLNNAGKYTDPGGRIDVRVHEDTTKVRISVSDTGIGIDPELRHRVFDLFTQATGARERAQGGLGLGLGLARRLVELHHGTIEAHSAGRGSGSEFVVTLPLAATADAVSVVHDSDTDAAPPTIRRRVLVADDNVDAADTIAMFLEGIGCDVRTVYDGESAIREAESYRPDLLLLDLGMPGVSGQTACRQIRGENWGANMTIAALTGWGQDEDRRRTRVAGFDHHLVKPVEPSVLLRLVRELPHQNLA
jgi:PAS domain S-box-containing protein